MKKFTIVPLVAVFGSLFLAGFTFPGEGMIALAVKVIQDVSRKTESIDWTKAKKGDFLFSGDLVKTGDRSIAIVKFKDNSMLRIRHSSELKLFGEEKEGVFSKTVNITRGEFTFDIKKQENEKFTFSSPTSVAAIRGTEGTWSTSEDEDVLIVLDGLVNLLNTLSNNSVDVGGGQTGISGTDGTVRVRESTPAETEAAQKALRAGQGTGNEKQMDIQMQDADGNKKTMRIRYRD